MNALADIEKRREALIQERDGLFGATCADDAEAIRRTLELDQLIRDADWEIERSREGRNHDRNTH